MKILRILLPLLLICALAGGGYLFWTRTPQYSMLKLREAVNNHDVNSFQRYFDANNVAFSAVDELTAETLGGLGGPRLLRRFLGATLRGFFKPQMTEALARNIIEYVEKKPDEATAASKTAKAQPPQDDETTEGRIERAVEGIVNKVVEAIRPPSLREVLNDMGLTKENYKGLTDFEVKDKLCHVGLVFQPPNKDKITVILELENLDDHWHVVRISNLGELSRILTESTPP